MGRVSKFKKSEYTANVSTSPMDADRPKKLGGWVMGAPR